MDPQIIYFDVLDDNTVSVLVKGSNEWDLFKSMHQLTLWAEFEFSSVEYINITDTTYQQRVALGVFE